MDGSLGTYERTAEIQLQQLHIRLSYQDWLVFQKIVDSFPKQANEAFEKRNPVNVDHQLNQLTGKESQTGAAEWGGAGRASGPPNFLTRLLKK